MKIWLILLFICNLMNAQTMSISNPFLIANSYDFGILDPLDGCSNTIIVANGLSCSIISGGDVMQITIPTSFELTNTGTAHDVRIQINNTPVAGQTFPFVIERGGSSIGTDSFESFSPNTPENLDFVFDIAIFGPTSKNQYSGEVTLTLIII